MNDKEHSADRVVATILIDRVTHQVTNSYSVGPGAVPHSYDLINGDHVYEIAGAWTLVSKYGQRSVSVEIERYRARPCECETCKVRDPMRPRFCADLI